MKQAGVGTRCMNHWRWETFDALLSLPGVTVAEPGPLASPVIGLKVSRDPKRNLIIETRSRSSQFNEGSKEPLGTVRTLTDTIGFESDFGLHAIANGVWIRDQHIHRTPEGQRECVQRTEATSIQVQLTDGDAAYVIDWLENVDRDSCRWSGEALRSERQTVEKLSLGPNASPITLKFDETLSDWRQASLDLNISGVRLFVCAAELDGNQVRPGCIIYVGSPNEEFRRRVREVVGFCLGMGLVYLGSTSLDSACQPVSMMAVAPALSTEVFDHVADPPAPLGHQYHVIEQERLNSIANAIMENYDDLDFRSLSWAYWHAVCAPIHMRAAHFGAAIEGVQAEYSRRHPSKTRAALIQDSDTAAALLSSLNERLEQFDLKPELAKVLRNKITGLNQAPPSIVSERLFAELGLKMGADERAAWTTRNRAAHGARRKRGDSIPTIRSAILLRIMLNRLVLRIASASPTYWDAYTPGYKIRGIGEPVQSLPT